MFKLLVLALVAAAVFAAPSSKIESKLADTLSKGTANILVQMKERTSPVLAQLQNRAYTSRDEQVTTVAHSLMDHAAATQKAVIAVLEKTSATYEVLWITNQVYVRNADAALVQELASVENVQEITEEFWIYLDEPIKGESQAPGILAEWGVENIKAHLAWTAPGGNNGAGAVVGGIDTGVRNTHQDLSGNFRGTNYGWRDVTLGGTQTPRDDNGHGTHTMGTIVGGNGIGVAPGAQWITCKGLNGQGGGTNAGLISCGQWMACPTLPNGQTPDCTKAPHVVSNSWGGGQANAFYNDVINAWHAANIIPVFANGNSGPACRTANSPADSLSGVIGVGATTQARGLASFSSKGPTAGGRMKPDISAPGQNVRSAWHTGNNAYNTISGTSMACPHVAGVVALLKAKNPSINFASVNNAINNNANRGVTSTGMNCGGVAETTFPNHAFGHGEIDALAALTSTL